MIRHDTLKYFVTQKQHIHLIFNLFRIQQVTLESFKCLNIFMKQK